MSSNHALIAVQKHFQSWRTNKTSPQQAMPEELKVAALELRQDFSDKEIAKALNITASQFRLWFSRQSSVSAESVSAIDFVELPVDLSSGPTCEPVLSQGQIKVSCCGRNATEWQLEGCLDPHQIRALVLALNTAPEVCS